MKCIPVVPTRTTVVSILFIPENESVKGPTSPRDLPYPEISAIDKRQPGLHATDKTIAVGVEGLDRRHMQRGSRI